MKKILLPALLACCALTMAAQLSMPAFFSHHMVLQRNEPVAIWGEATPGQRVVAYLDGTHVATRAARNGHWSITLPAHEAGGPYTLQVVSRRDTITINDILFGEVWIASGQSNMEFRMRAVDNAPAEVAAAQYPAIRTFNVAQAMSNRPQHDLQGEWMVCSPATAAHFSAVAYFFARELHRTLGIPVGIINTSWGGTDIEAWMSADTLARYPKYNRQLEQLHAPDFDTFIARTQAQRQAFEESLTQEPGEPARWYDPATDRSHWATHHVPGLWDDEALAQIDGVVWFATTFDLPAHLQGKPAVLSLACIDDDDKTWVNGTLVGETVGYDVKRVYPIPAHLLTAHNEIVVKITDTQAGGGIYGPEQAVALTIDGKRIPLAGDWRYKVATSNEAYGYVNYGPNTFPSQLFNAMVNPLLGLKMKGVIWYQGENNASRAHEYYALFPSLINDWRARWGNDFAFYWVQLAAYMQPDTIPTESSWASLRDAQTATLALPHTGQAVTIDIGDAIDIHPRNKHDVGRRLALHALRNDYGHTSLQAASPSCIDARREGSNVVLTFTNVAGGLTVRDKYGYLRAFAVAGDDGIYHWAQARLLDTHRVLLTCPAVSQPRTVRYAWSDNPGDANLYSTVGLPATPFEMNVLP